MHSEGSDMESYDKMRGSLDSRMRSDSRYDESNKRISELMNDNE